jgi:hypothetical protein
VIQNAVLTFLRCGVQHNKHHHPLWIDRAFRIYVPTPLSPEPISDTAEVLVI